MSRGAGNHHAPRRRQTLEAMKRQVGRLFDPRDDEIAIRLKNHLAMPAHLAGRDAAGSPIASAPLHRARNCNAESLPNRTASLPGLNRANNPLS